MKKTKKLTPEQREVIESLLEIYEVLDGVCGRGFKALWYTESSDYDIASRLYQYDRRSIDDELTEAGLPALGVSHIIESLDDDRFNYFYSSEYPDMDEEKALKEYEGEAREEVASAVYDIRCEIERYLAYIEENYGEYR